LRLLDLFLLAGAALVVAGVFLVSLPAALIAAGFLCVSAWVLFDDRGDT